LDDSKSQESDMIGRGDFDFIDFGASEGGSIEFVQRVLRGERPLGIDIDPEKVARMKAEGFECVEADATALDLPEDSVRFVVMSHFLEHLPSLDHVRRAIESAATVARDFLFIQGPFFDADDSLAESGLKFYWSSWTGHKCHLTSTQLAGILDDLGLRRWQMMFAGKVADSFDASIHPLSSPLNQAMYQPGRHLPKARLTFQPSLFREIVCMVNVGKISDWEVQVERVASSKRAIPINMVDPAIRHLPATTSSEPGVFPTANLLTRRLQKIHLLLLLQRGWDFLRYLHLRDAIIRAGNPQSVLMVSADRGLSSVALAIEFSGIEFLAANFEKGIERFQRARGIVTEWSVSNLRFDDAGLGALKKQLKFDLVALPEILHLVAEPAAVASAALRAAENAVFALMPLRSTCSETHGISNRGATDTAFKSLFPGGQTSGCYWKDRGALLRNQLESLSDDEIRTEALRLVEMGMSDFAESAPQPAGEAMALKTLLHL
jgi:hypothetical protein